MSRRTTATVLGALSVLLAALASSVVLAAGPAAGKVLGSVATAPATAAAESVSTEAAAAGSAAADPGALGRPLVLDSPDADAAFAQTTSRTAARLTGPAPASLPFVVALVVAVMLFLFAHRRPDGRDARLLAVCGAADVTRFR